MKDFYEAMLARDHRFDGKFFIAVKTTGGWDGFETAVCSILGQMVSAEQRANLVGQLVRGYGAEVVHPVSGEKTRLFPRER